MSQWDVTYWHAPFGLRTRRFEAYDIFGLSELLYSLPPNSIIKIERVPEQG